MMYEAFGQRPKYLAVIMFKSYPGGVAEDYNTPGVCLPKMFFNFLEQTLRYIYSVWWMWRGVAWSNEWKYFRRSGHTDSVPQPTTQPLTGRSTGRSEQHCYVSHHFFVLNASLSNKYNVSLKLYKHITLEYSSYTISIDAHTVRPMWQDLGQGSLVSDAGLARCHSPPDGSRWDSQLSSNNLSHSHKRFTGPEKKTAVGYPGRWHWINTHTHTHTW